MGLLNDKENEAANRFAVVHYERCKMKCIEVNLFAKATGIAFSIKVQCPKCKSKSDITDYDSW